MSNTFVTTIRFNLDREEDRRALDYLQGEGRNRYGSYTRAIIGIVNSAAAQQEKKQDEDAAKEVDLLQKVEETVRKAIDESPLGSMAALMRMMQVAPMTVPTGETVQPTSDPVEDEAEEDWSGADDFMNAM